MKKANPAPGIFSRPRNQNATIRLKGRENLLSPSLPGECACSLIPPRCRPYSHDARVRKTHHKPKASATLCRWYPPMSNRPPHHGCNSNLSRGWPHSLQREIWPTSSFARQADGNHQRSSSPAPFSQAFAVRSKVRSEEHTSELQSQFHL